MSARVRVQRAPRKREPETQMKVRGSRCMRKMTVGQTVFGTAMWVLFFAVISCGGGAGKKGTQPARPTAQTTDDTAAVGDGQGYQPSGPDGAEAGDEGQYAGKKEGLQVKGLLGTIDEQTVARAFSRKRYQIEQCIMKHARAMTYLTGKMKLKFEVDTDGSVTVKVRENNLGHYEVEDCLLKVARSLSFGKPKGGKARVTYPLDVPHRGTPHVKWGKARVRGQIRAKRRAIKKCRRRGRPRHFTLHFYVLPGGRMISLGAHAKKGVPPGFAACVFNALKNTSFPDPLGKVAKVKVRF